MKPTKVFKEISLQSWLETSKSGDAVTRYTAALQERGLPDDVIFEMVWTPNALLPNQQLILATIHSSQNMNVNIAKKH